MCADEFREQYVLGHQIGSVIAGPCKGDPASQNEGKEKRERLNWLRNKVAQMDQQEEAERQKATPVPTAMR